MIPAQDRPEPCECVRPVPYRADLNRCTKCEGPIMGAALANVLARMAHDRITAIEKEIREQASPRPWTAHDLTRLYRCSRKTVYRHAEALGGRKRDPSKPNSPYIFDASRVVSQWGNPRGAR